jgi:murein DD-endopeptidase MepM/ murein hydrolase activator NlpD
MKIKQNKSLLIIVIISILFVACDQVKSTISKINQQKINEERVRKIAAEEAKFNYVRGEVKRNQGMFQALKNVSITNIDSLSIINLLSDKVEFTKLKVGDDLIAKYDENKNLVKFTFSNNPAEEHILKKDLVSKRWSYSYVEQPTFWKSRVVEGKLKAGSTLQRDLVNIGIKRSIVGKVVNILLCKVNFRVFARANDEYKVLLQERMFNDQVLETKVLYTSYKGKKAGFNETYFYLDGKKSTYTAHYTEDGEALIRSGLRYPVKRLHIRSGYGKRRHPVTGRYAMHRGVDLKGRHGSPVYSVARGIVVESKMTPIGGNKIAIKHNDKSISYYLHLQRRLVKVGQRVKSHQLIGKVGSTGRVTGPHLHFGFKNPRGKWMNPMHKRMIATPRLKGKKLANLKIQINEIKSIFSSLSLERVSENKQNVKLNNI